LAALAAPVLSQDRDAQRLKTLKREFRQSRHTGLGGSRKYRLRLLGEIAELGGSSFIIREALPRHADIRIDILRLLAEYDPNDPIVAEIMQKHMGVGDPNRALARRYLLAKAIHDRDNKWLLRFFNRGRVEDRFLSLNAMGRIRSKHTLNCAERLAADTTWQAKPETEIEFATIAHSVSTFEGPRAARVLLLMRKDPRFGPDDESAMRAATRLWRRSDLRQYIDILELANPDVKARAATARFLGLAGIESARAPLWMLANDARQPVEVRAAAAEALGGLTIARGHLATQLGGLARAGDIAVRRAAVRGLGHLHVLQAATQLVAQLKGPVAEDARAELSKLSGKPAGTDWVSWLATCKLQKGT